MTRMTFGRFLATVGTVFVGVILAVVVIAMLGSQPGHPDIYDRQERVIQNQESILCLLIVSPEDRSEEVLARCQVDPDSLVGNG